MQRGKANSVDVLIAAAVRGGLIELEALLAERRRKLRETRGLRKQENIKL